MVTVVLDVDRQTRADIDTEQRVGLLDFRSLKAKQESAKPDIDFALSLARDSDQWVVGRLLRQIRAARPAKPNPIRARLDGSGTTVMNPLISPPPKVDVWIFQ